jgi:PAS domain S-box-containing protein
MAPSAALSRLLIVEDDLSQLRTLTEIFREEGFEVIGCPLAAEALQFLEREEFSVAILDLRLPDLHGTQLLARINALTDRVRVIIHTAYGSFDSAKEAVNLGAFAFVEKLSDPAELVRHVHRAAREHIDRYARDLETAVAERTQALRQSEEQYRELFENAHDVVFTCDLSGRFLAFNKAAERLSGYHREEVLQMNLAQLVPPGHLAAATALLEQEGAEAHTAEWELIARDGRHIPLEVSCRLIREEAGRPIGIQVLGRDITDRRRAEELRVRVLEQVMAAQADERRRLAQTLNDNVAGSLAALLTALHTLDEASSLDAARQRGGELRQTGLAALREVEQLVQTLWPTLLDDLGLAAALENLAAAARYKQAVEVAVTVRGLEAERLPPPLEAALYRLANEGLTHIGQRARTRAARIAVERQPAAVRLLLADVSANPAPAPEEKFLARIREIGGGHHAGSHFPHLKQPVTGDAAGSVTWVWLTDSARFADCNGLGGLAR